MAIVKKLRKLLPVAICIVLITAMALSLASCGKAGKEADSSAQGEISSFALTVIDAAGNEQGFVIETEEKTVGAALLKEGLIEGEEGPYGLYIKSVNGITADYDTDGTYWAFYINGEYAMSGVDTTEITPDASYMLKVEK